MCHSLTPLVTHASHRKVLRCSCGSLHVVWDNLNLSLTPEEFTGLRGVVVQGGAPRTAFLTSGTCTTAPAAWGCGTGHSAPPSLPRTLPPSSA